MEIKYLEPHHFYELRDLLDGCFSRSYGRETSFALLFPRLFSEPNAYVTSSHLGAFEEGRLIGTAAIYPLDYVVGGEHIRLLGNGNIAVHWDFRNRGIMTALLHAVNDIADTCGDLGYLHGNPIRYGRVGYIGGGIEYLLTFQPNEKTAYQFIPIRSEDRERYNAVHETKCDYITRQLQDVIPALKSGKREALSVLRPDGTWIGGLSLDREKALVEEFGFVGEYEAEVFPALANLLGKELCVRLSGYNEKALHRLADHAIVKTAQPALFRMIHAERLQEAALALGLSKDVLFAPYLT